MIWKNILLVAFFMIGVFVGDGSLSAQSDRIDPLPDFTYWDASGAEGHFYDLQTAYILLYLNNPDCDICRQVSDSLAVSSVVDEFIEAKKITVLGLCPDSDTTRWKSHPTHLSPAWINACDKDLSVLLNDRYDVKHIPALYLLDRQKRLLLKDTSVKEMEAYLSQSQEK